MDIKNKINYVKRYIENISRADDTDSALRNAALDKVVEIVAEERAAMQARIAEKMNTL